MVAVYSLENNSKPFLWDVVCVLGGSEVKEGREDKKVVEWLKDQWCVPISLFLPSPIPALLWKLPHPTTRELGWDTWLREPYQGLSSGVSDPQIPSVRN